MKKTKFITCIYTDLFGTELGGRPGRYHHYRWSLLSLLKMTDADFLCYTSESELQSLKDFFYVENKVSSEQLKFSVYDIWNCKYKNLIDSRKDVDFTKRNDRCIEIQYSKFAWWFNEDGLYENYFWIDAGLSHCGLIPTKYLEKTYPPKTFYESNLFNNDFLKNLLEFTGDKFFLIGKDNVRNFWSQTVNPKWYTNYERDIHIIGGLFGGKKEKWQPLVDMFENYMTNILKEDEGLPHEELIMTLMYYNNLDLFNRKHFDIWWCRESAPPDTPDSFFEGNKSFFRILEELNNIYE
jgi:hypothetical protein